MKRFESLDWLRGLMAFAIMIYHLIAWKFAYPQSGNLLGNLGIYGVSIFFVLSGLSMAIVYNSYIKDYQTSFIFFIRRLFRLLPLLWVAIFIVSAGIYFVKGEFDLYKIFLNITLLFGFVAPDAYINIGAWSIGNEVFYYAFTPFLIILYAKNKALGNLSVFLLFLIGMYFAFFAIDANSTIKDQWETYINPFNNFFLYACGLALYYNFHNIDMSYISNLLIVVSVAVFCFYPVEGDQINIVTGFNRVIFSIAAIALTLGFYKLTLNIPSLLSKPLANLGEATYGVYLLHPIVFFVVSKLISNPFLCIALTMVSTVVAANLSYQFYEKKFIKIGKRFTTFEVKKIEQVS
ncbi:acyltransferase [Acinetobacter baumannii]|uniref:acyltransferase family protein n=1 Tax=Acinetobacter baumannii TaxID=470 RepID=UPI0036F47491